MRGCVLAVLDLPHWLLSKTNRRDNFRMEINDFDL